MLVIVEAKWAGRLLMDGMLRGLMCMVTQHTTYIL